MHLIGRILLAPFQLVWFLLRLVFLPVRLVFKVLGWLLRFVSHNLLGGIIGGALGYMIGRKMAEPQEMEQPQSQPSDKPRDAGSEETKEREAE